MIKLTAGFLIAYAVMLSAVFFELLGKNAALSCLVGGGIMLVNLGGFYFALRFYILKKSIARTVAVIISKYVLLSFFIWSLTKASWISPVGFVAGLSALVLAILSATVIKNIVRKR